MRFRLALAGSAFLACLVPLLAAEPPAKEAWPLFRGNALQTGVAASALPDTLEELWKFETKDSIEGAPAVAAGVVYVGSMDEHLHAVDFATGKEQAAVDLGAQSGATAAVAGDRLYVGTMGNQVEAIDWKKAAVEWTFQPPKRPQPFYSSAAVTEDLVVIGSRDKK